MTVRKANYKQIARLLTEETIRGKYSGATRFPSAQMLARRFGVTRFVVRQALDVLVTDGLLVMQKGRGAFVTHKGSSRKIGLVIPGVAYSEFFPPIVSEVSRLAQANGYALLFGDVSSTDAVDRANQARRLADDLIAEKVSGVIFQPIEFVRDSEQKNREIVERFDAAKIPVLLLDCDVGGGCQPHDVVGVDNFAAGRLLAEHVMAAGARNIVFVMSPDSDASIRQRYFGAEGVVLAQGGRIRAVSLDLSDREAVRRVCLRRPRVDAFLCRSDTMAAHLLVGLRQLSLRIPGDVMVAGFNDVQHATIVDPPLTTVRLPCAEIAGMAFRTLIARITDPTLPIHSCYLPASLVIRASTAHATLNPPVHKAKPSL